MRPMGAVETSDQDVRKQRRIFRRARKRQPVESPVKVETTRVEMLPKAADDRTEGAQLKVVEIPTGGVQTAERAKQMVRCPDDCFGRLLIGARLRLLRWGVRAQDFFTGNREQKAEIFTRRKLMTRTSRQQMA